MARPVTLPPVSYTGPDGDNQTYEPVVNCPEMWGNSVMGFDLKGGSKPGTADPDRKAEGTPDTVPGTEH